VSGLAFSSKTDLAWSAEPGADAYDLVTGRLSSLLATGGDFIAAEITCPADDIGPPATIDTAPAPDPGEGRFYLVRAIQACRVGTYGTAERNENEGRDIEISSAAQSCVD